MAPTEDEYARQMERVMPFATRVQIDLTDGYFAEARTVSAKSVWWPTAVKVDFHLMYRNPMEVIGLLVDHKPNLIIVHAESEGQFQTISGFCRHAGIKVGLALLPKTSPQSIAKALEHVDHVLLFSGDLGKFGGRANLDLLRRVHFLKDHKPSLEIGWDGGVNSQNAAQLVAGGIDVLNVGGAIHHAPDPEKEFYRLQRIADETGTT